MHSIQKNAIIDDGVFFRTYMQIFARIRNKP